MRLILGNCLEVLRELPDNSVDAIVTDPPYGLGKEPDALKMLTDWIETGHHDVKGRGFMGKEWDAFVPQPRVWHECLRVLKPGGHLLAFAGTRTQDLMTLGLRLAGFEIRDMIAWVYSTGFPKSHNFGCKCSSGALPYTHEENLPREPKAERDLRPLWNSNVSPSLDISEGRGEVLQPCMSQSGASIEGREQLSSAEVWSGESSMEGWGNILEKEGQLQANQVCPLPKGVFSNGEEGRVCDGTPFNNGEDIRALFIEDRSSASCEPQPAGQPTGESRAISKQRSAQERGVEANQVCEKCRKLTQWKGWGTALKPALEPITLARKPLEGTVASNVLKWHTGALNIDGCRVTLNGDYKCKANGRQSQTGLPDNYEPAAANQPDNAGRWPANLIHDGSEEVVRLFPQTTSGGGDKHGKKGSLFCASTDWQAFKGTSNGGDTGSAARFFYCAKANKRDRDEGCEHLPEHQEGLQLPRGKCPDCGTWKNAGEERCKCGSAWEMTSNPPPKAHNNHPTVKPTDLMRYLCRLITPQNGVVLDPFMGSGSTGKAAALEGFQFIGIERDPDYFKIAEARITNEIMGGWEV